MAAEYSYVPVQTVDVDDNVLFMDGDRACRKGFISHRTGSGIFFLKGATNGCKAVYRVTFDGNIAVAPAAIGDYFNVSLTTFIDIPCGCCVTVSVENVSATSSIDVQNANIIFDRVA